MQNDIELMDEEVIDEINQTSVVGDVYNEIESLRNEFLSDLSFITGQLDKKVDDSVTDKVGIQTAELNYNFNTIIENSKSGLLKSVEDAKINLSNSVGDEVSKQIGDVHRDLQTMIEIQFEQLRKEAEEVQNRSIGVFNTMIDSAKTELNGEIDKVDKYFDDHVSAVIRTTLLDIEKAKKDIKTEIMEEITKQLTWKNLIKILLGVKK
jgi:hypothetical protein